MRAAIYARVSTTGQRDSHTIESQLRSLRRYAKQQGWTVVGEYLDDGKSAATGKLEARDGFHRLIADADRKLFEVVLVVDVDRLTRTNSMEERAAILGPFQRNGIDIVTPSGGRLDLGTFLGEFFVTMQAIVAAEEKRKILYRTSQGKARAMAEGRKPQGRTPFGYRYDRETGAWSLHERAAELVREIFRRVAAGEACVDIADDFADRGARPQPVSGWTRSSVYRLTKKRYYTGTWMVDRAKRISITIPAILTEREWRAADRALESTGIRGLSQTRHVYLLEGLGVCGVCGGPMYIRSEDRSQGTPAMYVCAARRLRAACKSPLVRCGAADDRVWATVEHALAEPSLVAEIERRMSGRRANQKAWATDVTKFEARLARLAKTEEAVLARFRRGAVSEGALDVELAAIGNERAAIGDQLETARVAAAQVIPLESAQSVAERLRAMAAAEDAGMRQKVVRAVIPRGSLRFMPDGTLPFDVEIAAPAAPDLVRASSSKSEHVIRLSKIA